MLNIIDTNGLIHRSFHQDEDLRLDRFVSLCDKIETLCNNTGEFIFTYDSKHSFRRDEYPLYKKNRPPKEAGFSEFYNQCKQLVRANGYTSYCVYGWEADDIAGAFVNNYNGHINLITADKDWLQLVRNNVNVILFRPSGDKIVNVNNYEEVSGFDTTGKFTLYQIINGDKVDNIRPLLPPSKARDYVLNNYAVATTQRLIDDFGSNAIINYKLIKLPYYKINE